MTTPHDTYAAMTIHQEGGGYYARANDGRRTRRYASQEAAARATERMTDAEYAEVTRVDTTARPRGARPKIITAEQRAYARMHAAGYNVESVGPIRPRVCARKLGFDSGWYATVEELANAVFGDDDAA